GSVDLLALGPLQNLAREVVVVGLEPRGDRGREIGGVAHDLLGRAVRLHRDDVVRLHLVAGDIHPAPVHVEVAVTHELARLRAGGGEAEEVHDVVEPRLEHPQQHLAGDAGALGRLLVVRPELLLQQPVEAACLLLLTELEQVLRLLDPAAAVLARRIAAALDRALVGEAALALEEQLHPLAAALLALRRTVSRHLDSPPFLLPDAVVGLRRDVADAEDLEPGRLERPDRRLATRPRALDEDLDLLEAVLHTPAGSRVGGHLRGERGRLPRALEAGGARRLPDDHRAVLVGQRDDRVVERRLDVRLPDRDVLLDAAAGAPAAGCLPGRGHLLRRLLATPDRLLRPFAGPGIGLGALPVDRQPAAVADPTIGADLDQALDRLLALTAEVTLD